MNQDIKHIWIDALTSGEYKQGVRRLKDGDTYCCLGVLCDLHRKIKGKEDWSEEGGYLGRYWALPEPVVQWAKLNTIVGNIGHDNSLASFNDSGKSFLEIAEIIEDNF